MRIPIIVLPFENESNLMCDCIEYFSSWNLSSRRGVEAHETKETRKLLMVWKTETFLIHLHCRRLTSKRFLLAASQVFRKLQFLWIVCTWGGQLHLSQPALLSNPSPWLLVSNSSKNVLVHHLDFGGITTLVCHRFPITGEYICVPMSTRNVLHNMYFVVAMTSVRKMGSVNFIWLKKREPKS